MRGESRLIQAVPVPSPHNNAALHKRISRLGAWDRTVAAKGYLTGVYSSQDSGIDDMQAAAAADKAGFTRPDAIWIALWDGKPTLDDGTLDWPIGDREKQHAGNLRAAVGGITLSIDRDQTGQTGSREVPSAHKLTSWPYAVTASMPLST